MIMMRRIALSLMMVSLVVLAGCGSTSKKKSGGSDGGDPNLEGSNEGISLELNADSDSGKAGGLQTVFFAYNSASLNSSTRDALSSNADFLKSNGSVEVQVEGHCDERGGVQYNLALGERRANAVRKYLVSQGVDGARISTISFGKERPVSFGHDEEAWSRNRRGNFVVTAK